jgi:ElaB/YqjD/DUF883 family membrane-anchored ribosome-binding protein
MPPGRGPVAVPTAPGPLDRELPPYESRFWIEDVAQRLGALLGAVEEQLTNLPDRFAAFRRELSAHAERLSRQAGPAAADFKRNAEQRYQHTRARAQAIANRYPIETIAGAAAAAFVLGFALRLRRSNHARR